MVEAESQNSKETMNVADSSEVLTPEKLVRKYASAVLGVCLAHTKNLHDSEDIMQEVFLKAVRKFNSLKNHSKAKSWVLTIARRKCIDHYRKSVSTQAIPDDIPVKKDCQNESVVRLHNAIGKLPEGYREPITLYYLDGKNCANVAKFMGISEEAVRSRLVRARFRLHELLSEGKL